MAKLQKTSNIMLSSVTITDVYCTSSNGEVPEEALEIAKILARILVEEHISKVDKNKITNLSN